jgi:hypothetical protein
MGNGFSAARTGLEAGSVMVGFPSMDENGVWRRLEPAATPGSSWKVSWVMVAKLSVLRRLERACFILPTGEGPQLPSCGSRVGVCSLLPRWCSEPLPLSSESLNQFGRSDCVSGTSFEIPLASCSLRVTREATLPLSRAEG